MLFFLLLLCTSTLPVTVFSLASTTSLSSSGRANMEMQAAHIYGAIKIDLFDNVLPDTTTRHKKPILPSDYDEPHTVSTLCVLQCRQKPPWGRAAAASHGGSLSPETTGGQTGRVISQNTDNFRPPSWPRRVGGLSQRGSEGWL